MDNEYYLLDNGARTGPYTSLQLMDKPLEPGDVVILPSQTQGVPAHSLPEFSAYFKKEGIYYPTKENTAAYFLRLPAFIIDYFILVVGVIIVSMLFFPKVLLQLQPDPGEPFNYQKILENMQQHQTEYIIIHLAIFMIMVLYHAVCESGSLRGSLGKYVVGLAVVDELGYSLTFLQAAKRNLGKIIYELLSLMISIFAYFVLLRVIWGDRHQAIHDQFAGCFVIKKSS